MLSSWCGPAASSKEQDHGCSTRRETCTMDHVILMEQPCVQGCVQGS